MGIAMLAILVLCVVVACYLSYVTGYAVGNRDGYQEGRKHLPWI